MKRQLARLVRGGSRWAFLAWMLVSACESQGAAADDNALAVSNAGRDSGASSNESTSGAASESTADVCSGSTTPDGRMLCDVRADRMVRCNNAPRQTTLDVCRNESYGLDDQRINCRFVTIWAACVDALSCEENVESCATGAFKQTAPTLLAGSAENPEPVGWLAQCYGHASECGLRTDDCFDVALLREPYRTEGGACIAEPCTTFSRCLGSALGRVP